MPRDLAGRKGRERYGAVREAARIERETHRARMLDVVGEGGDDLFDMYRRDFTDWDDQTQDDRDESIIARDFYDGIQWTDEEIDKLNERQQPILTTNLIKPKINFVLGSETENRNGPKAHPRTPQHEEDGEIATDAIRAATLMADYNETRSNTAEDMYIEGYGGAVFYVDEFEDEDEDRPPRIRLEHVLWDRLYYDPRSRRQDFSDALYMGIVVWMHREEAEQEFLCDLEEDPDEYNRVMGVLNTSYARDQTHGDGTHDAPRRWRDGDDRVQWFETYRKIDGEWTKAIWGWGGFIQEPEPVGGIECCVDEETGEEYDKKWGFVDSWGDTWCPLVLGSAFVTRDNARYGLVKDMISPQEEVNKRKSKALHQITNRPFVSEDGAIQDPDEFAAELSKPDGNPTVLPGRLKDGAIQFLDNVPMAQAQLGMMQEAVGAINQIGPHAALVASDQRVQSGRMFMARQQAGAMEIKPVEDHLRHWTIRTYKGFWRLIRVYWTEEMWVRVLDDEAMHKGYRFVALNRRLTVGERIQEMVQRGAQPAQAVRDTMGAEGVFLLSRIAQELQKQQMQQQQQVQMLQQAAQQAQQSGQPVPPQIQQMMQQPAQPPQDPLQMLLQSPAAQEEFTENDIPSLDVDILLDTEPTSPIIRHEQYQELSTLLQTTIPVLQDPSMTQKILAMQIQHSDLRSETKRQFVQALMPKEPSPQEQQQQAQLQQQQMQLTLANLQATVQKLESEVAKNQAQAQKLAAEAQAVPASAQLDQAQAEQAAAKAGLVPHEAQLKDAQALKAAKEAGEASVEPQVPGGTGGP